MPAGSRQAHTIPAAASLGRPRSACPAFVRVAIVGLVVCITGPLFAETLMYVTVSDNTVVTYDVDLADAASVLASRQVFVPSGTLSNPFGLTFKSSGDLAVANLGGQNAKIYSSSGSLLQTVGSSVAFATDVAYDSSGNLYVSSFGDSAVYKYDSSGTLQQTITANLSGARGLAFDSTGNLYVSNQSTNNISKYDSSGTYLSTISGGGLNGPRGMSFDFSGNLWVANNGNGTMSRFDSAGNSIPISMTGLAGVYDVGFDSSGSIWTTNLNQSEVRKYDSSGNFLFSVGAPGNTRFLSIPTAVPEPSTWVLGTIAAATIGFMARRRRGGPRAHGMPVR